jgi:hypothetical protein
MLDFTKKQSFIVVASKELVDWMISINTHNRPVRKGQVDAIRQDIRSGRFMLTNQGIGITASGFVNDGQHRLIAIRDENYPPVEILVVTGLSDDSQVVVDRHAKRSQADVIRLVLNHTVSNRAVAAVNVILKMKDDSGVFALKPGCRTSEFDIAEYISENHDTLSAILSSAGDMRAAAVAALIGYATRHSTEKACNLAEQIKTGIGLTATCPAYRARQYLARNKGGGSQNQVETYSMMVSVCISHAKGESMSLIRPSSSWDRLPKKPKTEA